MVLLKESVIVDDAVDTESVAGRATGKGGADVAVRGSEAFRTLG